jgi:3-phenylpropionate/trans-cinnamate dioxygenase ferredoxin subunit
VPAEYFDAIPADFLDPGTTAAVEVDGFPVAVANVDGEYFAFQNLCPHQGTRLGGRKLEDGVYITCPMHASRYDVRSGACVRPSSEDGFNQDLMVFPTRVKDEVVQVQI